MNRSGNRDYLANERTFLAYLRTALAFIAFGFVIARFSLFAREISVIAHMSFPANHASAAFGTGMAKGGIAVALYGSLRYVKMDNAIRANLDSRMPIAAAVAGSAVVAVIGLIVAVSLFAFR